MLQIGNLRFDFRDMGGGQTFDFAAVAMRIFLQMQQAGDLCEREADGTSLSDKLQAFDVGGAVLAIAGRIAAAVQESVFFVVADLFGG